VFIGFLGWEIGKNALMKLHTLACCLFWAFVVVPWAWAEPPRPSVGEVSEWVAQEGEDLLTIAHRHTLAIDHLTFANGWPQTATRIYPDTRVILPTLRILPKDPPRDGICVNLPERMLFFFEGGRLERMMPVSIGAIGKFQTPTGHYRVNEKAKDPTWYPPAWAKEKGPVGPGPDNPLGDRWIGLTLPRFGIHSTHQPWNVGHNVTHGCLRAYPDMLRELYPRVSLGMPVRLEYETVKLGKAADGRRFLLAYPDAYGKVNPVERAKKIARALGYTLSAGQLKALDDTTGLPIWLDQPSSDPEARQE
jgi:L,D-transpeptidase ErfK/SrfK